ncbi:hypothetical protein DB346_08550 [Verrucomicrobia bacterium LW23]|nr:hypothetical protein DB346_08550 [Verrucomicrobia bacterium LW23]
MTTTPQEQNWLIRAAQSWLRSQGYDIGTSGRNADGVDGDLGGRGLTLTALRAWGQEHFPMPILAGAMPSSPGAAMLVGYQTLWQTMVVTAPQQDVRTLAGAIRRGKERYEAVSEVTGVPWEVVGIIHALECYCDFTRHLHNGDALSARTVRVPAGRPKEGKAPFNWEYSAADALEYDMLAGETDWSVPQTLRRLEGYNGLGYRKRGVNSPYLWSGTNHYTRGKFTSDGVYDPKAVSKQIGAAVLLAALQG